MSIKEIKDPTYFQLNNEINIPVDGQIPLHKDKEARDAYLIENVEPNRVFTYDEESGDVTVTNAITEDLVEGEHIPYFSKVQWLVNNDYYESEFIQKYQPEFIEELRMKLQKQNHQFQSFMAIYKFYKQYALLTNDRAYYLEDFEDRILATSLFMANGDEKLAESLANVMVTKRYVPATPTLQSAGRKRRGEFASCFITQISDNMSDIGRQITNALQLSRKAGGVGIIVGNLRSAGAPIKKVDGLASGVVPVMKLFEDSFSYSNQLGTRPGAGVAYLPVFHSDVIEFLSTKKENADEKIRLKTLSLGLTVPNKFYELAKSNSQMALFDPYFVEKEYGIPFTYVDIDKEYDNLVANPKIRKKFIKARELEQKISELQQESGYPFIINISKVNESNPIDGRIIGSNLCSEILQIQTPSKINEQQEYELLGQDIVCNLGSTNITNLMESTDFEKDIEAMVRGLTFISDATDLSFVPTIENGNNRSHAIGLGAMGLHSYLANNEIHYDSEEAVEFTSVYFMLLNYYTLKASNQLAKEKGAFVDFEKSDYANGSYFNKYLENDYFDVSEKVKELFNGIKVPTKEDWKELSESVKEHGLHNAYRMAVAPNGSISYVNDSSASIMPIVHRIEERQEGMTGKIYYPAYGLSSKTIPFYKSAYDTDMRKVIDVYAAATEHTDQGLSMNLFLRSEIPEGLYEWKDGGSNKMTTRDLSILRNYAYKAGIKSIYYVRTFTEDDEYGGANECESCMI